MEERVARLRERLDVELVAEVGRVLREDAVAEEREDGGVLALERELELRLEVVEVVEVGHQPPQSRRARSVRHRPAPGNDRLGIELDEGLERETALVEARMRNVEARLVDDLVAVQEEVEVERPRAPAGAVANAAELDLTSQERVEKRPRAEASSRARRPR